MDENHGKPLMKNGMIWEENHYFFGKRSKFIIQRVDFHEQKTPPKSSMASMYPNGNNLEVPYL